VAYRVPARQGASLVGRSTERSIAVTEWQYCKIIEPTKVMGKPVESSRLLYLGPDQASEQIEEIDTPEHALARLGEEGWELVDHTQLWSVVEGSGVLPVMEVFYLKREVE
jgi:hypothetical protein